MHGVHGRSRSSGRLFVRYVGITVVPVVLLGLVLAASYRAEAAQRGLAEGRSEAALVAQTAVEPILDGRPLSGGLSASEKAGLTRLVSRSVGNHDVLRLRVRDLSGRVVFSDDGSGFQLRPEDEALDAARGAVVARLTLVNTDSNDTGRRGVAAVEVYRPLYAGAANRRVGVLEVYLPYAPISADVASGLHRLYVDLSIGLALLFLALLVISASVSRGLRREVKLNAFLAEHDALTNLPNRLLFQRRAKAGLELGARRRCDVVVAILDVDRFKEVNDTLGHENGDKLLGEVAVRLAGHMRSLDTVARLGGDEFGLVLYDADDPQALLTRLRALLDQEFEISGLPLSVSASIGYAIAPDDGGDVESLLQRADMAMYVAKAQHLGVVRYHPDQNHYDAANLALVSELRHAIETDQLVLHYQPKTRMSDGRIEAVEALVRWQHPEHGLLSPDRFIPLAEQTDLIDRLTTWALVRALADVRLLEPTTHELTVAVNVSARTLVRSDFADEVKGLLAQSGVDPRRLIVEITETALLTDPEHASSVLAELAGHGVEISIDDFGSGHTSLGYLSRLPVHELKIDRSFVTDMVGNPAHAAIVRSIVDLGHNLAFRVVGEGVETEEILTQLRMAGCDVAQGYLLARPMPIDQLGRWLEAAEQAQAAEAPAR